MAGAAKLPAFHVLVSCWEASPLQMPASMGLLPVNCSWVQEA